MDRLRRALARRLRVTADRLDPPHQSTFTVRIGSDVYPVVAPTPAEMVGAEDLHAWLHNHVTMPAEWMARGDATE